MQGVPLDTALLASHLPVVLSVEVWARHLTHSAPPVYILLEAPAENRLNFFVICLYEREIERDIKELLGNYSTKPLKVYGRQYGSKFTSEIGSIIVTSMGMELHSYEPGIIIDSIRGTTEHEKSCSLIAKGKNGDIYKVSLGSGYLLKRDSRRLGRTV
jgi:hypothetical protein